MEWCKQCELMIFLNMLIGYVLFDRVFDFYKYLMVFEISNMGNKGMLQGKYYFNVWFSVQFMYQIVVQFYFIVNLMDKSILLGFYISVLLIFIDDQLEVYIGVYLVLGSVNFEFVFFGDVVGGYVGFKYYL